MLLIYRVSQKCGYERLCQYLKIYFIYVLVTEIYPYPLTSTCDKSQVNYVIMYFWRCDSTGTIFFEEIEWKLFLPGFEPPTHGLKMELSTTELFYMLMSVHKIISHTDMFTYQLSVRTCFKISNWEQFHSKCEKKQQS